MINPGVTDNTKCRGNNRFAICHNCKRKDSHTKSLDRILTPPATSDKKCRAKL